VILTVTTGRSGTGYLCSLLQGFDICVLHEPEPNFVDVMRDAQSNPSVAERFLVERKLPFIRGIPQSTYLETSHLACKGFIEPLLKLGIIPDLIILNRDRISVATSLYRLQTIPGRTSSGLKYLSSPDDPGVLSIGAWRGLHDWALCYWYCLEIERRASVYRHSVTKLGGNILETSVDSLETNDESLCELINYVFPSERNNDKIESISERRYVIVNQKLEYNRSELLSYEAMIEMVCEVDKLVFDTYAA
jgi:hypothetical protein